MNYFFNINNYNTILIFFLNIFLILKKKKKNSRGPGTTIEFALAITKYLADAETAKKVAGGMVLNDDILASL